MLELTNPKWNELVHAHGTGKDIPPLLKQLQMAPAPKDHSTEPWSSIWSNLCPDNRVFTASYAAVPHIVDVAATRPQPERLAHLHLVSMIEALRHRVEAPALPAELTADYLASIQRSISLMLACLVGEWNGQGCTVALGGLAALLGQPALGMAIFEFTRDVDCPQCGGVFPAKGYDLFVDQDINSPEAQLISNSKGTQ